jgi:hypothetical protein
MKALLVIGGLILIALLVRRYAYIFKPEWEDDYGNLLLEPFEYRKSMISSDMVVTPSEWAEIVPRGSSFG